MALENRRASHLYLTYAEDKTGNENAPNSYKSSTGRIESRAQMPLPKPTRMQESNKLKLGQGQFGTASDLQSIFTPWNITTVEKFSEALYFMSYMLGRSDSVTDQGGGVYTHLLEPLYEEQLTLPTFSMEYGDGTSNESFAGNYVNDMSVTIPIVGGNGKWDISYNGFGNGHYSNSGTLTKLANGSLSSVAEDTSSEPLLNGRCCTVWIGDAIDDSFSINFDSNNLQNAVNITSMINSITITYSNNKSGEDAVRAGACGVLNDWTKGNPTLELTINLRKNESVANWDTYGLADTQKAIEILYRGNVFTGSSRYAVDMFFHKVQVVTNPEDDETPISQEVTFECFEDSLNDAFRVYAQSPVDEGYNA